MKIRAARADFSQTSHGGWPVAAAIDASPTTGWSIFPETGIAHAAIFEPDQPIAVADGMVLTWKLSQGERSHSLGRFRLSITEDTRATLPSTYHSTQTIVQATVPATQAGGALLLVGHQGIEPNATLVGKKVPIEPVWSDRASWQCPWKAWRCEVGPATEARQLRVTWKGRQAEAARGVSIHFLPK